MWSISVRTAEHQGLYLGWNAQRIEDAMIGVSVARLDPPSLKSAIERVLNDPKFVTNSRKLARKIANMPTAEDAANVVLGLMNTNVRSI